MFDLLFDLCLSSYRTQIQRLVLNSRTNNESPHTTYGEANRQVWPLLPYVEGYPRARAAFAAELLRRRRPDRQARTAAVPTPSDPF